MRTVFSLLLGLFPRHFRERFGDEVVEQAVEDCRRARTRGARAGWWCAAATAADLVRSGLAERWAPAWTDERKRPGRGGVGMTTGQWMRDLKHAGRRLGKAPAFAAAAVATLALALGANAAIFSVVDAVLLDPLPFEEPDRLVHIAASAPGSDLPEEFGVSLEFFLQYGAESERLESLATFNSFTATVRAGERVERLRLSVPSMSLFETLGVDPVLGRLPRSGEGYRVAVISHGLWTTWFGSDPGVVGQSHYFVDGPKEIVGVMGPDLDFPDEEVVAWIPAEYTADNVTPGRFGFGLVGRLAPGADHGSLARELSGLAARLPELYGGSARYAELMQRHVPVVRSLEEWVVGPVARGLWVLMGAVGVVLVIACANVANLFAVRAEARGRDQAVRRALGAGRGALLRVQLAEALLVAVLAGAAALALAWLALPAFLAAVPDGLPRMDEVRLSASTVAFTAGAAVLAALLCGLLPALRASVPDLARLRDGVRGTTGSRHWLRHGLVVSQTALTLVLLVGAGLLLRTFQELRDRDPGYVTEGVLTFQFAPDQEHLVDGPTWARFHQDVMARIEALPGVESVGIVENVPLDEGTSSVTLVPDGGSLEDEGAPRGSLTFAGGDYFDAMGIEVIRGRGFTDGDLAEPGNVVVSQEAAERLWPGLDPLGRRLRTSAIEHPHTVVGVVEDVLQDDLRGDAEPLVYYPLVGPTPDAWALASPGYVVRTAAPEALVPAIRGLVREVAPEAPVYRVHTIEGLVSRSVVRLSFTMLTLAVAAGLALLLGTIGLYGVLSHVVAERTREIGVRMALGAEAGRVRRMVVGQGARVVGLGILVGLAVAFAATRVLSGMLYGVAAADAATFAVTSAALAVVGLLAAWIPARRASRVDPVESMRGS